MSMSEILLTIKLHEQLFVDPKRIRLLKAIEETGSINQGAKLAQVSYKSAWDHLEMMDRISPKPLLERNAGGKKGGGTKLTAYAQRLLQLYKLLEDTQQTAFDILQQDDIPLDNPLFATSLFSLQSSARNQFFGAVSELKRDSLHCLVGIPLADFSQPLFACVTPQSAKRLQLTLDKEVMFMIKAPWVELHKTPVENAMNQFKGVIKEINQDEVILQLGEKGEHLECVANEIKESFSLGEEVYFTIDPSQIIVATLL